MKYRPSWDEIFMIQAALSASRHSCLKRGVGAVLVQENRIISEGYNGAAKGITSCRELGYCYYERLADNEVKVNGGKFEDVKEKFKMYCQAVHAEANCLGFCSRKDAEGGTLYTTNYPCPKCVQDFIISNGIRAVKVWKEYLSDYALTFDEKIASERKLLEAGVAVSYLSLSSERFMEISKYAANQVGERVGYKYKRLAIKGGDSK